MSAHMVSIRFEGKTFSCRADTSLAVALWEQGIRVLSHSPKYGRPRGVHCARGHCTSCLLRVDGVPNVRSCRTRVRAGMRVERQDSGAFYGRTLQKTLASGDRLFPVGFYFKWFTRPAWLSRVFLKSLRPLTGVGRLPDPASYESPAGDACGGRESWPPARVTNGASSLEERYDTVVVGAGCSGLRAAASQEGSVLLLDDQPLPGGQRRPALDLVAEKLRGNLARFACLTRAHRSMQEALALIQERAPEHLACGGEAVAGYGPDSLLIRTGAGLRTVRTGRLIWAAGALDVLGLFPGNDLPGLFGPRSVYRLVARDGMSVQGQRAVVVGEGLDFWLAAATLHAAGAQVSLVLTEAGWQREVSAAVDLRWQLHTGLSFAHARSHNQAGLILHFQSHLGGGSHIDLACDIAVIARPGKPAYDIPYQLGAELVLDADRGGFVPRVSPDGLDSSILPEGLRFDCLGEAAGMSAASVLAAGS